MRDFNGDFNDYLPIPQLNKKNTNTIKHPDFQNKNGFKKWI